MNIWMIDDDAVFLDTLREYAERVGNEFGFETHIKTSQSAESLEERSCLRADVILLDIDMPGESGLEFAVRLKGMKGRSERPYLIFVTGHDSMVFDALKTMPYSFVRKSELSMLASCLQSIAERLKAESNYVIHCGRDAVSLPVNEIIFLEKNKNYVEFHTLGSVFRERTQMDDKYRDLKKFGFIRIHIGCLVNPQYVAGFKQDALVLNDKRELPISRKYRTQAKNSFFDWMMKPL